MHQRKRVHRVAEQDRERVRVCENAHGRSRVRARRREGRTRGALSRHRVSRQTAWQLLDLFIRLAYLATYIRTSLCTAGSRSNKHPARRAKYRLYLWTRPSNLSIRTTNANSNLCSPGSRSKYPGLTPGFQRSTISDAVFELKGEQ